MSDTVFIIPDNASIEFSLKQTENGLFNAAIHTALIADSEKINFCVAKKHEEITGIIYNSGDEYLFSPFEESFFEEAKNFFAFCPGKVFSSCENLEKLNLPQSNINILHGKNVSPSNNAELLTAKEIQEMYKLISGKNSLSSDEEKRYIRYIKAINASLAAVFGIKENGRYVSFAAVSASNNNSAIIADVFTLPAYRNRGFAAECVRASVNFAKNHKRTPFVFCEEKNRKFYEKLNFEVCYGSL